MIFRKIILYGFFKKTPSSSCKPSPGSHANKDLVVGEKSQLQEGPGAISPPHPPASQGLPPTLRPLPCTSYPAPLSLGREKLRGPAPRRAAAAYPAPTLHLPPCNRTRRPRPPPLPCTSQLQSSPSHPKPDLLPVPVPTLHQHHRRPRAPPAAVSRPSPSPPSSPTLHRPPPKAAQQHRHQLLQNQRNPRSPLLGKAWEI